MFRVVGVFGDALQLAVLYHVQRADGGVDVAREEVQHALAQRRQRQFADDRLAQLGLAGAVPGLLFQRLGRSEEHTSELQALMRISYAVFCLKKKITQTK